MLCKAFFLILQSFFDFPRIPARTWVSRISLIMVLVFGTLDSACVDQSFFLNLFKIYLLKFDFIYTFHKIYSGSIMVPILPLIAVLIF